MKKLLAIVLASLLILSLFACGKEDDNTDASKDSEEIVNDLTDGTFTYAINEDGDFDVAGFTPEKVEPVDITIPSTFEGRPVTGIAADAFKASTLIKSVTIPDSILKIGNHAFYNCDLLTAIVIPDSVTEIGVGAFEDCSALADITLPKALTKISAYAFRNCTALDEIALPETVTTIGDAAFWGCTALTSFEIPAAVTELGNTVFYGSTALAEITFLSEAEVKFGEFAFSNCAKDEDEKDALVITVKKDSYVGAYCAENGYNFSVDGGAGSN